MPLLDDVRVVDFSEEVAGPYCTKLLSDAGADVVKVEAAAGDSLRRWTASGAALGASDGALFQFLNTSKRSIVGDPDSEPIRSLLAAADLVVVDQRMEANQVEGISSKFPQLGVVSITPFGRTGPWAKRPASEFVLQALSGSTATRGSPGGEPYYAAGRLGEWIAGVMAAIPAMAVLRRARRSGRGAVIDVSILECLATFMMGGSVLGSSLQGESAGVASSNRQTIPAIEPTADDYIGFAFITAQQWHDFLVMIGRAELVDDAELATSAGRQARRDEVLGFVREWTRQRTSAEIEEVAAMMRIPVSPIGRPETITGLAQFRARGIYQPDPAGRFLQPRPPYRVDETPLAPMRPSPRLGADQGQVEWSPPTRRSARGEVQDLPLQGIRLIDLTAFWAGPAATQALAALGAEVIKVEAIQRPDGMRFNLGPHGGIDAWWESSSIYLENNFNKQGVTLDLTRPEGVELLLALVAQADALIENFSPRVLDNFGVTWDTVRAVNPRAVMVRMPAFGLSGPWRDRTGIARTMEQASGMAWITGFRDGPPVVPGGPCDPLAGMHAAFALLAAIHDRDRSGRGHFIESPMVESALNVAAEIVLEYSAYGAVLTRDGNRGPVAAPQGLYRCAGEDNWLALAIVRNEDWVALRRVLGEPEWARSPDLDDAAGRRAAHDLIDEHLGCFFADRALQRVVDLLIDAGIPAGAVVEPARITTNPQLLDRRFIETLDHPVVGRHKVSGVPFRLSSYRGPWFRTPPPLLGQHNREILQGILGLSDARIEELRRNRIIGERPIGT
jgi:crotonobetainyl-CoA:carnitine CoA-transferase CaiB-like acyl-CoA transferase